MIEIFALHAVVSEFIVLKVIMPSNTVVKLSGSIVIIPFHGSIILQKSLEFGQFEDSVLSWKGGG